MLENENGKYFHKVHIPLKYKTIVDPIKALHSSFPRAIRNFEAFAKYNQQFYKSNYHL